MSQALRAEEEDGKGLIGPMGHSSRAPLTTAASANSTCGGGGGGTNGLQALLPTLHCYGHLRTTYLLAVHRAPCATFAFAAAAADGRVAVLLPHAMS